MRICLLGGTGQLGHELHKVLEPEELLAFGRRDFDITNKDKAYEALNAVKPDVIIHAAAVTDVDLCEDRAELAYRVNGKGTGNIAEIADKIRSKLVYISTDYVFDGEKGSAYNEGDKENPINIYGKSKLMGEDSVKGHLDKFFIVRTAWLYGHKGKNFIKSILSLTNNNSLLTVVNDQRGCPTYGLDLSRAIYELIKTDGYGTYHLVNEGQATWYDFAEEICRIKGIEAKLLPISSEELQRKARRPKNSTLNNNSDLRLRGWQTALEDFLKNRA